MGNIDDRLMYEHWLKDPKENILDTNRLWNDGIGAWNKWIKEMGWYSPHGETISHREFVDKVEPFLTVGLQTDDQGYGTGNMYMDITFGTYAQRPDLIYQNLLELEGVSNIAIVITPAEFRRGDPDDSIEYDPEQPGAPLEDWPDMPMFGGLLQITDRALMHFRLKVNMKFGQGTMKIVTPESITKFWENYSDERSHALDVLGGM